MTGVQLNYVNKSSDVNNSSIVIFQKNVAPDFDEHDIAWKVIKNCGRNDCHPFVYPHSFQLTCSDSFGNVTPRLDANHGQQFVMVADTSGDVLKLKGSASSPHEVELGNDLPEGSVNAMIYKSGKLLASKVGVSPGQKVVFQFKPEILIGVADHVEEGEVMSSAVIAKINTEVSLLGMASADIVMTGGGVGPNATPFQFTLENVVMS